MPIVREKPSVELVKIIDEKRAFNAYAKLRLERMKRCHVGTRMKRAAEAEKRRNFLKRRDGQISCLPQACPQVQGNAGNLLLRNSQQPHKSKPSMEFVKITDEMRAFNAYAKLRLERMKRRHVGTRMKRVAEAKKRSSEL
ncbi:hypothetical protein RJ639_003917 [Escallonia herrerae]|uniref:Uncharacterized protein n=1 Tax=Escallonia herrerae TaxID=1293975 RepID=A0AA89AXZ3_9ASTE|nr:hypothetical protein RJ639_003917 [Escallonia herrerae]